MNKKKTKHSSHEHEIYENVFEGLGYYPTIGSTYHLNRSKSKVQKLYLEAIEGIDKPKILDIGCYIGTDLFMLPKPNPHAKYCGVDISKDAIKNAKQLSKKRGETNIEFEVVDANKPLPFSKNYFDVVLSLEMIEHLVDPLKFLKEINRVVKLGGHVVLTTPNDGRITNHLIEHLPSPLKKAYDAARHKDFSRHGKNFHLDPEIWDDHAHISLYGYNRWKKLFNDAGFSVEKVDGSSIYGGTRIISDHPFLLGMTILADAVIDKLPFKPHLQMCLIVKLKKNEDVA